MNSGVLVAVSIPIFTAQLEKSREAVDQANIRDAYAVIAADSLSPTTGLDGINGTDKIKYTDASTDSTGKVTPASAVITLTQKQDDWQTDAKDIAGVDCSSLAVGAGKKVQVTVSDTGKAAITIAS